MVKKTEKQPGRGPYKKKECPYCGAMVGNLGNHVKMKHAAEAVQEPPRELTIESLTSGVPARRKAELAETIYYCIDCHSQLRKGEASCWNCGAVMNWEGLE